MGVLEFFGTLFRNGVTASSIIPFFKEKIDIDHFFIDFNSIIHNSNQYVITEINEFMKTVLKNAYEGQKLTTDYLNEMFNKYEMKEDQKEIIKDPSPKNIVKHFVNHFNDKYVEKIIIKNVFITLKFLVGAFCKNKTLKTLMIAIDGVPSKGKMIEQKQRRYMSAVIECYKEKIFDEYKQYLRDQPDYIYYNVKNSIFGNRNKITPGTGFMDRMVNFLREEKVSKRLKRNRPNLEIIISDMYEVGEGEKKIMNYIHENINKNSKVMVYSPDSDVILLCMLLPTTNTFMLRHNKQSSDDKKYDVYDLINIQTLKENISFYVNTCTREKYLTDRINYDIIFLATIFGNDFVPKIESINVKTGFQNILDAYLRVVRPNNYLVNFSFNFTVNFNFLKKILRELIPLEKDFILNNSLYNKYIMTGKIKYVFSYMNVDIYNIRQIVSDFRRAYGRLKGDIQNNNSVLEFETNDDFMYSLKRAIDISIDDEVVNTIYLSNREMIDLLKRYYEKNNKFPPLNINDNIRSHSIKDSRFQADVKKKNEYEIEILSFDKMLDDYYIKFNAEPLDLRPKNIGNYYQKYFSVKLYEQNNSLTNEALKVMETYIEGILWVFNYYFNDRSYISSWYYKYERAPLLQHLLMFLNSIDQSVFDETFFNLNKYSIDNLNNYFNPIEQFIYVSPMTDINLNLLPSNYREFIENNKSIKKYFVDIPSFTQRLWDEKISKEVDCHSIPYLNKCFVSELKKFTHNEDMEFLKILRQVKKNKKSSKRSKIKFPSF